MQPAPIWNFGMGVSTRGSFPDHPLDDVAGVQLTAATRRLVDVEGRDACGRTLGAATKMQRDSLFETVNGTN